MGEIIDVRVRDVKWFNAKTVHPKQIIDENDNRTKIPIFTTRKNNQFEIYFNIKTNQVIFEEENSAFLNNNDIVPNPVSWEYYVEDYDIWFFTLDLNLPTA